MHVKKMDPADPAGHSRQSCGAVIVAAGAARRMAGVDKIMADLGESPSWSGRFGPLRPRQ